jgi:integrase
LTDGEARRQGRCPTARETCLREPDRSPKLARRRCSLWLAHGFEPVLVKQWSGHSKASMLHDVYGHVISEPEGDEWRSFWLAAYDAARQPRRPERLPGVAPVRPGEAD